MSFHLAITSWGIYLTEIEAQVRIMHIRIVILAFYSGRELKTT